MEKPTIAAGFAAALLMLAESKGADRHRLLARAGLDPKDLARPDNRVSLESYLALMEAGKELCAEPALALHFGEMSLVPETSVVYLICRAAETVAEAYVQMNRYARLVIDADGMETTITYDKDEAWLELRSPLYSKHPQLTESGMARVVCGASAFFGEKPFVKKIHVTFEEPAYRAEYNRIFKVPIIFGSYKNAMLIDKDFLSFKLSPSSRYVFSILCERADSLLQGMEVSKTVQGKVKSLLLPILHTGELGMQKTAEKMGLNRQTLYRKLKAEGVLYEKLLDDLRHQMALQYLNGKKVSVKETSYLLGFVDPGSFSRAFKRWTGGNPSGVR